MLRHEHNKLAALFGVPESIADEVNYRMDFPSQIYGSSHRFLFHSLKTEKMKVGDYVIKSQRVELNPFDILYATEGNPLAIKAYMAHLLGDSLLKPITTVKKVNKNGKKTYHR
ncbi:MAG: hypothetical protein QXL94_00275 [Candidatus Parvarchaeum sp.]